MKALETETGEINTHSLIEKHHVPQLNSVEKTEIWSVYFSKWKHAVTTLTFLMKMEILWRDNLFSFKNLCVQQAFFVLLLLYIQYIKNVFLEANGNDQSISPRKPYKQPRKNSHNTKLSRKLRLHCEKHNPACCQHLPPASSHHRIILPNTSLPHWARLCTWSGQLDPLPHDLRPSLSCSWLL